MKEAEKMDQGTVQARAPTMSQIGEPEGTMVPVMKFRARPCLSSLSQRQGAPGQQEMSGGRRLAPATLRVAESGQVAAML